MTKLQQVAVTIEIFLYIDTIFFIKHGDKQNIQHVQKESMSLQSD